MSIHLTVYAPVHGVYIPTYPPFYLCRFQARYQSIHASICPCMGACARAQVIHQSPISER